MSFKNLEQRYNEKVNDLYSPATAKFENGKPSRGINDDPLIVRKPGNGYWNFAESRSTPISSTFQDVKRLTLFTTSVRGVKFLAKQQLLQTGNTFESTRIINPLFVISNATPFLHTKRAIDIPVTVGGISRAVLGNNALTRRIFGSGAQKTDIASLRRIAQLQKETYNKAAGKKDLIGGALKKIPVIGQTISAARAKRSVGDGIYDYDKSRPELSTSSGADIAATFLRFVGLGALGSSLTKSDNSNYIMTKHLKDFTKFQLGQTTTFNPVYGPTNTEYVTYFDNSTGKISSTAKKRLIDPEIQTFRWSNVGFVKSWWSIDTDTSKSFKFSEDFTHIKYGQLTIDKYTTYLNDERPADYTGPLLLNGPTSDKPRSKRLSNTTQNDATSLINKNGLDLLPKGPLPFLKYFTADQESIQSRASNTNAKYVAESRTDKSKKISYINDPSNRRAAEPIKNAKEAYKYINTNFDDPVVVSFAMGNDDPIKFRAYVTDLAESSKPQYQAFQYIGRIEKFINYTGVQRDISFKLALLAFSKNELDGLWRRINYLTGMTFPYGFAKGLLQPNIIRLTMGNVYTDQPGYITSLDTNFKEPSESWDIDKDVPIGATVTIRFTLIEKATRVADSPFYGITEKIEGFSEKLDVAQTVQTNTTDVPANAPIPVRPPVQVPPRLGLDFPKINVPADNTRVTPNTPATTNTFRPIFPELSSQGTGELNNARFGAAWRKYQEAAKPTSIFNKPIPTIGGN